MSITPKSMFNRHILDPQAVVSLCPCTAVVSGIEKCGKTTAVRYLLNHAIHPKYTSITEFTGEVQSIPVSSFLEESLSVENRECLSCYKVITLGAQPFEKLTWLMPTTSADGAVMCLLSYFAKVCKVRKQGSSYYYHELLKFAKSPPTSEGIDSFSTELSEQILLLYHKLMNEWGSLIKNKEMQAVMPTGVCLLNIFDVGPSKAAQAFCPFLNKYCKRSVNIACYSGIRDLEELKKEFVEKCDHHYYHSKKYQLLKPLSGCIHKTQIVNLTAIYTNFPDQQSEQLHPTDKQLQQSLTGEVQNEMKIEKVHALTVSENLMEQIKTGLEKSVIDAPFFEAVTLRSMLLLHRMSKKCHGKSFWMKRSEIETLSQEYMFSNGDLEAFLRLFSSFGNIFYTHDIPSLNEYVIVDVTQFVQQIHCLYNSNKHGVEKYGLFKQRDEDDWRVILEFLTILGIAAEVRSNQIVPTDKMLLGVARFYYYIPSARNYPTSDVTSMVNLSPESSSGENSIEFISLNGYSKENLQAVLCEHFLLSSDCRLIPTETINTTAIRFCSAESGAEDEDIQFTDVGNKVMMSYMNKSTITEEKREEILSRISPFLETNTQQNLQRQQLVEALGRAEQKKGYIQPSKMIALAKQLDTKIENLQILAMKFEFSEDWLKNHTERMNLTKCEVIQCMLHEFKERVPFPRFKLALQELDIHI